RPAGCSLKSNQSTRDFATLRSSWLTPESRPARTRRRRTPMTSAFHVYFGPEAHAATPRVRRMSPGDCISALKEGVGDVFAMPTYPIFVGLFYAVAGIALFAMTSFGNALHLAFPLAAGFALIGPFVAIGLYEMSRRRERGLAVRGRDAFTVLRSP